MKLYSILFASLILGCFISNAQTQQRVTLNITTADIDNIKFKITQHDWAKYRWSKIKLIAETAANDRTIIVLPLRGGNWGHYYVDPEEGKPLIPGRYLGNWHWEHYNQAHTKIYFGDETKISKDYDGVLILTQIHDQWANKLFALSLAYRVEHNKIYLQRALEIIEAYNKVYKKIPFHDKEGGHDFNAGTGVGRIGAQALDESVWLVKILQAISLIWDDLSPTLKSETQNAFLYPAVDMIRKCHNLGIQNISNWYNAAVGMTGYLAHNDSLIQWSLIEKDRGLKYQIVEGFTPDGDWYENAPSYHFYALKPIILLAETAKNNGNNTYINSIKKFLDAPIQLAMPDMQMPRFNDSRDLYLPAYNGYYEYGYARFKNDNYLPIINKGRQYKGGIEKVEKLGNNFDPFDFTLIYGVDLPQKEASIPSRSLHLPHTGFDVLTKGTGKETIWLASKYDINQNHGWHMHPDALDFVLYAKGRQISMDPGTAEYGAASHLGWDKTTVGHNSLVINQSNQDFKKSESISFGELKGAIYSFAKTDSAYKGVTHTRAYIIPDSSTVLIADWINADSISLIDLVYHQRGRWQYKEQGQKWEAPNLIGYKYLTDAEISLPGIKHSFSTNIKGNEIVVEALSSKPVSLITSMGLGQDFEPTPCVIARCKEQNIFVLWSINLDGSRNKVQFELMDRSSKPKVKVVIDKKVLTLDPAGILN
jgi:hypothetical protein